MPDDRDKLERYMPADEAALERRYPKTAYYPDPYGYGYGEQIEEGENKVVLADLLRAVRKRWWMIAAITILVTGVVAVEAFRLRHTFTARSMVEIRKDTPTLLTPSADVDPENAVSINTKMLMFKSRPFLEEVITKSSLDQNPKFLDVSLKRSRWETLRGLPDRLLPGRKPAANVQDEQQQVAPPADAPADPAAKPAVRTFPGLDNIPAEDPRLDRFVAVLERGLNVERVRETQALQISFTHTDPEIAALVANSLAQAFMERNFERKINKFTTASTWLKQSTRDLQAQVEKAEQELAEYTRKNNIFPAQGNQTLTTDKLVRLHDQAMRAEIDLLMKKSLYDAVQAGTINQLPEAFTDPKILALQSKLNELSLTESQLKSKYGPDHPRLREVQLQMAELQEQLDESHKALLRKLKTEYERAVRDDQSLKAALALAKSEAVEQGQSSVQYHILKQKLETARSLYNEFLAKTNQANLEVAQQQNNVSLLQPARVPRAPDGLQREVTVLLGFLLSLAGGIGLAFFLEYIDRSIKNVADVNRYVQLPTLGVIPAVSTSRRPLLGTKSRGKGKRSDSLKIAESNSSGQAPSSGGFNLRFLPSSSQSSSGQGPVQIMMLDQWSSVAEAYRALRTSVLLSTADNPPKTILFTSGRPGEGKTTTVINTAVSLAQLGSSVLIIDADLRKPTTHKGFSVKPAQGLSTCLSRGVDPGKVIQPLAIPNLSLLPCGPIPPNPAELISSERMKEVLRTLSEQYDHILIDSPPLMYVTDPLILSTLVDGVILLVQGGKSSRDIVRQSRQMLTNVGAKVFGVVLNRVNPRHHSYSEFAYYPYYSGYGKKQDDEKRVSDILS